MAIQLSAPGQIALAASAVDRSERFYGTALGLRKLFRFGTLAFFGCGGVRLMLERSTDPKRTAAGTGLTFRCADIALTANALKQRGVSCKDTPHRVTPMEDPDLWMTFCEHSDGHLVALMSAAPQGYTPPTGA